MSARAARLTFVGLAAVACGCDFGGSPSSVPYREVFYERVGGIGGFGMNLEVWSDGRVVVRGDLEGDDERVFSPDELQPLRAIIHGAEFRALARSYVAPNPCCDGFSHRLRVAHERGVQAVDADDFVDRPAVLERAMAELRALAAAVSGGQATLESRG